MKRVEIRKQYMNGNRRSVKDNRIYLAVGECAVNSICFLILLFLFVPISLASGQSATNFHTQTGIPGMPILSAAPTATSVGALYINSVDKQVYKYDGVKWMQIGGSVVADITLTPNPVLFKDQVVSPELRYMYYGGTNPATCTVSGSTYSWYRANDAVGTGKTVIASGTGVPIAYTVLAGDVGKYIGLGVTATTSCNAATLEAISWKPVSAITPSIGAANITGLVGAYAFKGTILSALFTGYSSSPVLLPGDGGGSSTYKWYYANDAIGTGKTAITDQTSSTYTVSFTGDLATGQYVAVGITPVASNGATGTEKLSDWYQASSLVPVYSPISIIGLTDGKAQNLTSLTVSKGNYSVTPSIKGTEGTPIYKWYYATSATGTGKTAISGQTSPSHTVNINGGYGYSSDAYYLAVGITPVTTTGETGMEVLSTWAKVQLLTAPDGTPVYELISPSGRVWMDRNLGATRAATSNTDYLAYGSMFQWCRAADGHQLINWTSATAGTPVNGTTAMLSATSIPGHSLFINSSSDWMSTPLSDGSLWWNGTVAGANNPCPTGYHVPTYTEWNAELTYITNSATAYSIIKLVLSGRHDNGGGMFDHGSIGFYWYSNVDGTRASVFYINSGVSITGSRRANGLSVRCIKN